MNPNRRPEWLLLVVFDDIRGTNLRLIRIPPKLT
jgi:hypothetical protein